MESEFLFHVIHVYYMTGFVNELDIILGTCVLCSFYYCRVKLLINKDTGEAVAMKMVDLVKHPDAADAVRKEICLHRMLKHANIIKFYGKSVHVKWVYKSIKIRKFCINIFF